jgi:hypothetical protein
MKGPIFILAILVENAASIVAFLGYLWICLLPRQISSAQDRTLHIVYDGVGWSLIAAWVCGLLSLAVWLLANRKTKAVSLLKQWGWISILLTLVITALHVATARRFSVGL